MIQMKKNYDFKFKKQKLSNGHLNYCSNAFILLYSFEYSYAYFYKILWVLWSIYYCFYGVKSLFEGTFKSDTYIYVIYQYNLWYIHQKKYTGKYGNYYIQIK